MMKTKIFSFLTLAAMAGALCSCSDDSWDPGTEVEGGEGQLNTASVVTEVVNEAVLLKNEKNNVKSRAVTNLTDFLVTVTNANNETVANWTVGTMPELPVFPVGSYKIAVKSHQVNAAAWEEPYFYGEQSFSIVKDKVTDVEKITCRLSNIRVTVKFDTNLQQAAASDMKVEVTSVAGASLEFVAGESRSGYFEAPEGLETLALHFTGTVNGYPEDFTRTLTGVAAGQHHYVTFTLKNNGTLPPDETGNIDNDEGINVDSNVKQQDLSVELTPGEDILDDTDRPNHEGDDPTKDPDNPDDPAPQAIANFSSETLDLVGVNVANTFVDEEGNAAKDAIVKINVPAGISNLVVKIKNATLEYVLPDVGLNNEFDLAYPGDLEATLSGTFGFPVGSQVIGKTDVEFDITNFVPLLLLYENEYYEFVITITDQEGKSDDTGVLTLKFKSLE